MNRTQTETVKRIAEGLMGLELNMFYSCKQKVEAGIGPELDVTSVDPAA